MSRILRILLAVLTLTTFVWGADDSPFNVDFFCGWEGYYRPMEWTPVAVGITSDLTKPFAGSVTISAQQDGLNTMYIVHTFVLTPDVPLSLPLVTKLAFGVDKCSVKISDERGRTRWHHDFNLWDFTTRNRMLTAVGEDDLLIGLIGNGKFGLLRLGQKSICESQSGHGKVYLTTKVPRMAPWDWTGFACLDVLILYNPDWNLLNRHQLNAIEQWVSNGGKLFLVLGSNPLPSENPIARLLPFQVQQIRQITIPREALLNWDLKAAKTQSAAGWPLVPKPEARLYDTENYGPAGCLFGSGHVGFGRVGVLSFDPSTLSSEQRANSAKFWVGRIASILNLDREPSTGTTFATRSIKFSETPEARPNKRRSENRYKISSAQEASNAVMDYLYNIPQMRPLSIWWVILLLTALALLLGPVDYKILKRKDRLPLTWLTSAGWITLFTVGAYYGVQALRGGKMQLRVVSVLDGIEDSDSVWSTTYGGLFAPYSDDFQLEGLQPNQWWSGIAPSRQSLWAYNREASTRKIYCFQHDGGNLPFSLPVNIWTIQCLLNESSLQRLPLNASFQRQGDQVTVEITNDSESPIQDGYVLCAYSQAFTFGAVPARTTKQFEGELSQRTPRGTYSSRRNSKARYPYIGSMTERAFFAQGCLQRTHTIDAYLAHGAAVVVARYKQTPLAFNVKDCSCEFNHVQLVRQVVFPKE
jgi:hypothetical protein